MQDYSGHLTSKLPDVGTTIFTVISREAQACGAGESFQVPGNTSFDIEVTGAPYHYVCHFG